ncbi:putative NAD-dependent protein deacylase [Gammaproteobacteria bacterium]
MELAMYSAFVVSPDLVWAWYLYRRAICLAAQPNPAHQALIELETAAGERFRHITQNVDGLYGRAGGQPHRTYCIHGNINKMRCTGEDCTSRVWDIPEALGTTWSKDQMLTQDDRKALRCQACGQPSRPHILWFDECYNEAWYQADSAMEAARDGNLLIIIGTSGATSLPHRIFNRALMYRIPFIVVDREPTVFSEEAEKVSHGAFVRGAAATVVPTLVQSYLEGLGEKSTAY